jgi:hypothetical protein
MKNPGSASGAAMLVVRDMAKAQTNPKPRQTVLPTDQPGYAEMSFGAVNGSGFTFSLI